MQMVTNMLVAKRKEGKESLSPSQPTPATLSRNFFWSFESPDFGWLRVGYSLWGSDILGFRFNIHPLQSLNISVPQSPPPWNEGDDDSVCLIIGIWIIYISVIDMVGFKSIITLFVFYLNTLRHYSLVFWVA